MEVERHEVVDVGVNGSQTFAVGETLFYRCDWGNEVGLLREGLVVGLG